jgi:hypothetical protein
MRAASVLLVVILSGCAAPSPSLRQPVMSPSMTAPLVSAPPSPDLKTPSPFAGLMPDDILLLRANTNLWTVQEERTVTVPASIVVYADGLVIADVEPFDDYEWRAVELAPEELETLVGTIAAAGPRETQRAAEVTCADCGVTVIRARATTGELVEMAVAGLYTENPEFPLPPAAPPSMLELSRLLDDLQFLAEHRKEVETTRVVPQVPASAYIGG